MSKSHDFIKGTLKAILWVALVFVILFVLVAGLIQLPSIQNKIIHTATAFVSNKTHTKVEIQNVSISFPKSVVIQGLFLEDQQQDTLLYAGEAKVNIALIDLLFNKISVNSLSLDNIHLNVHNSVADSLFNYNFLLTAFSDTATKVAPVAKEPSKWTFYVNRINLDNIRLRYDDNYGGMNAGLSLTKLKLKMDEIDVDKLIFKMDELFIDSLNADVVLSGSPKAKDEESSNKLPFISANKIKIENSLVNFSDSVNVQSVNAKISQLDLNSGSVDLENDKVTLGKLYLAESKIQYISIVSIPVPEQPKSEVTENSWKVDVKLVELKENSFFYDVTNTPVLQNSFDVNHLNYNHINLEAKDIMYSSANTQANIIQFNAIDKNEFSITNFRTVFNMDRTSITAKKLNVSTTGSKLNGEFSIQYESLESLKDAIEDIVLKVDIKKASIKNSDILYFSPELAKQDFFTHRNNVTTLSGVIAGPVKNLIGRNVSVTTGEITKLKTNFKIVGLPNAATAFYEFPNLHLISGKKDLMLIVGSSLPQNIELPEEIEMKVAFKGKLKDFKSTVDLSSSFGSANVVASIDRNENFKANLEIPSFDVGSLMKDTVMYGPVSMVAEVEGKGLDPNTIVAKIKATVSKVYFNKYNYHNLTVDGKVNGRQFEGKLNLNDKNAILDFDGMVNLNPTKEQYKFNLKVEGIDLQQLNFTNKDMRLSFSATADLKGGEINNLNGKLGVGSMIIAHEGKRYLLDSLLMASINEPHKSKIDFTSALVGFKYSGTLSLMALPESLTQFVNSYFKITDAKPTKASVDSTNFKFEIQLHNHPILSEVFLPELKEFEPGKITGSFDKEKQQLVLNAAINKVVYGSTVINNLALNVNTDSAALNYKLTTAGISTTQINLDNFLFDGKLAHNIMTATVSSVEKQNKKLLIKSAITKVNNNFKLALDPGGFYLMNNLWDVANDNYIEFGDKGFLIHNLFMNNGTEQINISSVNNKFNDDLNIDIKNFKLDNLSQIVEKDSSLLKGSVDGNVLLKRLNNSYGFIADARISNLIFRSIPIGDLAIKADNPTTEKFNVDLKLSGDENNITANGYFIPKAQSNSLNFKTKIQSLAMKTVEAFSMGQITGASGTMDGNFEITGNTTTPEITGQLHFKDVFITPKVLNSRLELKDETLQLKSDGFYLNSFTMLDAKSNNMVIDGKIQMKQFSDFVFGLHINSKDFLLFNTTSSKENNEFFGRMIVDSKIDITGPLSLPSINARLKLKDGSNFTFAVPQDKLTTDKGEGVVEFEDSIKLNSILYRKETKNLQSSSFTGFDLSSILEVDKKATLKLLMDPTSSDSLVVRGEAALSFSMDRSGKMSLTGAYNLNEGSYLVSLESVIKKKFEIVPGSTIIWNGDPLDANINIDATYSVRATPMDLMANQMGDVSTIDQAGYKQPYPFLVVLKLRGAILQPEISFEIKLEDEYKGVLGGAVNQKLILLNDDPSALNKQVFALLVLGRFVQENPLQTESGGTESLVRSTVSNFLSAQLNQLTSRVLPGVEMNFDIQSYNDYQSGEAQGRTQVEIGLKKQLFNERLSVELGGKVDVEGASTQENSVSDIASDVTVEYKIVKDGSYRLKAFRHNQYEGAIDGQLVETGVGVMFVKDFNRWRKRKKKVTQDSLNNLPPIEKK